MKHDLRQATGAGALLALGLLNIAAPASADSLNKDIQQLGMPWEESYGYAQAVKVGDTIWISGQLGHDDKGKLVSTDMEPQMRQAYVNIETVLKKYGLTMANVVGETLFVTDMDSAAKARSMIGHEVYPDLKHVTSTIIGVSRLIFPEQKIEIEIVAKAQ